MCWVSGVRGRETSFFPQRATVTSHHKIDANINILTFTATLCGSTKEEHGEEREESNQPECIQTTSNMEPNEPKVFTDVLVFTAGGGKSEKRRITVCLSSTVTKQEYYFTL